MIRQWPVPSEVSGALGLPGITGFVTFSMAMFWPPPHPSLSKLKATCSFQGFLMLSAHLRSSHPHPQELVTHKRRGQPPLSLEEPMEEEWALGWGRCLGSQCLGAGGGSGSHQEDKGGDSKAFLPWRQGTTLALSGSLLPEKSDSS